MSQISLRPYVPADAKRCAEIFRAAIDELAAEDYDADQREAWASAADDCRSVRQTARGNAHDRCAHRGRRSRLREPQGPG